MVPFLGEHLLHIVPALIVLTGIGWALYVWVAEPPRGDGERERWLSARERRRAERRDGDVDPRVARRGLIALVPLIAAAATGGVVYGIELARSSPGAGIAWIHAGVATLATLLVAMKLAEVGRRRIRSGLRPGIIGQTLASLALAALMPPLLVTGVILLVDPSAGSFSAYAHLIASGWWTLLLAVHLRRYLARALSTRYAAQDMNNLRTASPSLHAAFGPKGPNRQTLGAGGLAGEAGPGSTSQRPAPGLRPGRTTERPQVAATGRRHSSPRVAR